jgi:hypothetical protein
VCPAPRASWRRGVQCSPAVNREVGVVLRRWKPSPAAQMRAVGATAYGCWVRCRWRPVPGQRALADLNEQRSLCLGHKLQHRHGGVWSVFVLPLSNSRFREQDEGRVRCWSWTSSPLPPCASCNPIALGPDDSRLPQTIYPHTSDIERDDVLAVSTVTGTLTAPQ